MEQLCITYSSQDISNTLATTHSNPKYVLKGLIFTKNQPEQTNNKAFDIDVLFYDSNSNTFESLRIEDFPNPEPDSYKKTDGNTSADVDITTPEGRNLNYQFWDQPAGFVLFSKIELETILKSSTAIHITGAQIDYGFGYRYNNIKTKYTTLKIERSNNDNNNPYTPNVVVGLPCPQYWGDSIAEGVTDSQPIQADITLFSRLGISIDHKLISDNRNIYNSWNEFTKGFLSKK